MVGWSLPEVATTSKANLWFVKGRLATGFDRECFSNKGENKENLANYSLKRVVLAKMA